MHPRGTGSFLAAQLLAHSTMNPCRSHEPRGWLSFVFAALPIVIVLAPSTVLGESWTLEAAIGQALANSPDARIAEQRIAAARAGIQQANSALWPQLQLQSSYTRTNNPALVFGTVLNQRAFSNELDFNDVPDADDLNLRGTVMLPLYTGGRIAAGRDRAKANTAAATAAAAAVRDALGFETTRLFLTVLKTHRLIEAAAAAVRSFENNRLIARDRVDAGAALQTEVLDMEVRLGQTREDLVRARNAQALAARALRTVMGLETGEIQVAEPVPVLIVPDSADYSRRPELAAVREEQRAAEAEIRVAQAGYHPRVNAMTSVGYFRGWELDGDGTSYTAGVVVQWDLWDGLLTHGRIVEAHARLAAAREHERKLRLAIGLEIEQARLQLDEANERLSVTAATIAQAEQSTDVTRTRFEQGRMTSTQLIDAETALTVARVRRAEAESDRDIALAALRKALGFPPLGDE
jgi:outer membrane protein TolC